MLVALPKSRHLRNYGCLQPNYRDFACLPSTQLPSDACACTHYVHHAAGCRSTSSSRRRPTTEMLQGSCWVRCLCIWWVKLHCILVFDFQISFFEFNHRALPTPQFGSHCFCIGMHPALFSSPHSYSRNGPKQHKTYRAPPPQTRRKPTPTESTSSTRPGLALQVCSLHLVYHAWGPQLL